ncbi:MAG: hypothetical protein Ct9H300mP9_3460 [Candidatus Neomarinimicrobiota bacterium]|nr:MAG: hypothetical protein Ct9H300mP9_3460 [Candidatus Neomarinimicrobiota bacterium]
MVWSKFPIIVWAQNSAFLLVKFSQTFLPDVNEMRTGPFPRRVIPIETAGLKGWDRRVRKYFGESVLLFLVKVSPVHPYQSTQGPRF